MKILLFAPGLYSIDKTLANAFKAEGHKVLKVDYQDFFFETNNKLFKKLTNIPVKLKKIYYEYYIDKINKKYIEIVYNENPDLVFVYNDQYLNLKAAKEIKKIAKLMFILGDNPFYLFYRLKDMMPVFYEADYIFSSDSYWRDYFKKIGYNNIELLFIGYDKNINFVKKVSNQDAKRYSNDLVMIGRMYDKFYYSWGYKRALFYNLFTNLDIKIYGHKGWEIWYQYFPKLKDKVKILKKYLSFEEVNTILNCCKIYPIENNPGLIYGIHIRVFEAIGSGILPLPEYQKDYDLVFNKVFLPTINNYNNAENLALYYLKNDSERLRIIKELSEFVNEFYTPEIAVKNIINKV